MDDNIRRQLGLLASSRKTRVVTNTREAPCRWRPGTVINPDDGTPFSPIAAWELVAELIIRGHPIETVTLRKPPGRTAYVLLTHLPGSPQRLYVKLQLGSGFVIGRSFHYEEQGDDD